MKGSEYIAARAGITAAGFIVGGGVVVLTALWIVPMIMMGLEALAPKLLPPLGGIVVGLAVVILVAALMRSVLGAVLAGESPRFPDKPDQLLLAGFTDVSGAVQISHQRQRALVRGERNGPGTRMGIHQ